MIETEETQIDIGRHRETGKMQGDRHREARGDIGRNRRYSETQEDTGDIGRHRETGETQGDIEKDWET